MEITSGPVRIVIFDLGEVLASPTTLYLDLASATGRPTDAVSAAYWQHRDTYDRGETAEDFWGKVLHDLSVEPEKALIETLTHIDTTAWTTIRPDALDLLARLSGAGVRIGILSNATSDMARQARKTDWGLLVSDWYFSTELRLAKPDPAIYLHVTNDLGLPPESITFIDDRPQNVEAARQAGWDAHLWTSEEDTNRVLANSGALPLGGRNR